jgi:hypothetical protein
LRRVYITSRGFTDASDMFNYHKILRAMWSERGLPRQPARRRLRTKRRR